MNGETSPDPPDRPAWLATLAAQLAPWAGSAVVVAVSGGADSVGLLRGVVAVGPGLGLRISVACLDHGTRAGESARDAEFVAALAEGLGLACDRGAWRSGRAGHFEADARRARYAWLLDVAARRGAAAVLVGHTSDDQAETILHRIVRGTGLAGLAGMAPRRPLGPGVALARPLLGVPRARIRAYLGAIGQGWREDASNLDPARTRARVRHDLLPRLALDYNPAVADALVRLGDLAAAAERRAARRARRHLDRAAIEPGGAAITFGRADLGRLPPDERVAVIRLAWRRLGWPAGGMTHARWRRLGALAGGAGPARVDVGGGVEAIAGPGPGRWTLRAGAGPAADLAPPGPRALAVPGGVAWGAGGVVATLDPAAAVDERVDLDGVVGPLVVRPARPGDRFDPLGLGGRTQALADLFRAAKVPRADRPAVPIVLDDRGIVWVAGHRIAHRVRRTAATARTLGLRFDRVRDGGGGGTDEGERPGAVFPA